jgi:hypothetical protein
VTKSKRDNGANLGFEQKLWLRYQVPHGPRGGGWGRGLVLDNRLDKIGKYFTII